MAADVLNLASAQPGRGALYRPLVFAAAALALFVVGLGAYVRLSDAGLGCPDWPGCYGQLLGVPQAPDEQAAAVAAFPKQPLHPGKAWKEMIHRYAAGMLGLLIVALTVSAWRRHRQSFDREPPWLATGLVALVVVQAALGMWTVTLRLKPMVVSAHLLGGMTTWAILCALALRAAGLPSIPGTRWLRRSGTLALAAVIVQIALGGWVSSNYAALACPDLPTCQGQWWPEMDFGHAFTLRRELGETASGTLLPLSALTAIHWVHRLGAIAVLLAAGGFGCGLLAHSPAPRALGAILLSLLAAQLGLGISNVLLQSPLPLAVAHNVGAALLLAATLAARRLVASPAADRSSVGELR